MKNSKDPRTKILPSSTRRGKELPSSSALDSPSVLRKFATSPPAKNLDMSPVLDDATSAAHDTYADAMLDTMLDDAMLDTMCADAMLGTMPAMPDTALPLGALDAHIAIVAARCDDTSETADTLEVEPATMPELPVMPDTRYVMEGEIAEDFLACKDSYDVDKLLRKWKGKSLNARMKYDLKFATSPIFVTDKDYEFSVDPELITLVEQVLKSQNDLLNELNDNAVRVVTRGGRMTQEPLYPEGHPKRVEQDSQGVSTDTPSHPKKKKKDDRNLHASNPVATTPERPNDASISDAETQSGDEHEPNDNINSDVHDDAQPSNDKDVEIEPSVDLDNPQPKNRRYDKNDFAARKHGKEREPWVQKPMPFPPKPSKKKDDEDFERFVEMIRPVFLQMRLTDMLKMSPYAKYMKDIVTNKRRIPEVEISAMLANYTFKGGTPKKLGRYTIMPSDIYAYWGLAQPQVPVPEPPVEYETPVYQWEPEELTHQWHPQSTPEYPRAGYFPPWE
ncbi:hypothetical protein ZWY2020_043519 [Hordeum vulgare]|nr:hypothetical protein ZWY2020_043519 [Hordeum vulgare]